MRVLMLGWELPPHNTGGLGVACAGLGRALAEQGIGVTFVLPHTIPLPKSPYWKLLFADQYHKELGREGASYAVAYSTSSAYAQALTAAGITGISDGYGNSLVDEVRRYALRVQAIAENEEFDVIHAHDWLSFLAGMSAKRISGKPLILHVHATEFDRTGGRGVNQQVYAIERSAMEYADQIITVSEYTRRIVLEKYGIPEEKTGVVHNGINIGEYNRSERGVVDSLYALKERGARIVLFLGRMTIQKGPDYFVRAAERIIQYRPNTYFVMVGSGDMEAQVIYDVAYRGLMDKFFFVHAMGRDADPIYRSADVYVVPSVSEPFGITPLESIVNGTPVVISKQSGVAEVLTHAFKVDFWDTDEMANQIIGILNHPSLHKTLSENGYQQVESLTWSAAAEKCATLYKRFRNWAFG